MNKPLVSVVMITYNHEKYLEQAIKGVLMQKCNFEVELIVADDCSPDKTETIIKEIKDMHPNGSWIKYVKHKNNIGMMPNFIYTLKMAQGKYIAFCEGDDYWTDPHKLQKQVDLLEKNPHFSFCYHLDELLMERDIGYQVYDSPIKEPTTKDLIEHHFIPSESLIFKNLLKDSDYALIAKSGSADIPLVLQLSLYGPGYLIEESMSVYRLHVGGVTNQVLGTVKRNLMNIEYYKLFNGMTNRKYESSLIEACNKLYTNCIQFRNNIPSFKQRAKFSIILLNHLFKHSISRKQSFEALKQFK